MTIAFSINKFFDLIYNLYNKKEDYILAQTIYKEYIKENNEISRELLSNPNYFKYFLLELYRMGSISYKISNNHVVITEVNFLDYINKEFVDDLLIEGDSIVLDGIFDDGFWDFAYGYSYNIIFDYVYKENSLLDDKIERNEIIYRLHNSYIFITGEDKYNIEENEKYYLTSENIYETITGNKRLDGLVPINKFCKIVSVINDAISNNYDTDYFYLLPLFRIYSNMSEFIWCSNKNVKNMVITFVRGQHDLIGNFNVLYELGDILALMDVLRPDEVDDMEGLSEKLLWCKENDGLHSYDYDYYEYEDKKPYISFYDVDYECESNYDYQKEQKKLCDEERQEKHEYRWDGFDVKKIHGKTLAVSSNDDYSVDLFDDDEEDYEN